MTYKTRSCTLLALVAWLAVATSFFGCKATYDYLDEIGQLVDQGSKDNSSTEWLDKLQPYLSHDDYFIRSNAARAIGQIYKGTEDDTLATRCLDELLKHLTYREESSVAKAAARSLVDIGVPDSYTRTSEIETNLTSAARFFIDCDTAWYAIEAISLIKNPSDETLDELVWCLNSVKSSDRRMWKDFCRNSTAPVIAGFDSRAERALPDLYAALADSNDEGPNRHSVTPKLVQAAIDRIEAAVLLDKENSRAKKTKANKRQTEEE